MVQNIAHELSLIDPDNKSFYQKNAEQYISQIDLLDKKITKSLSALNRRAFMIYHGSYGYFAKDYNLNMVSIEVAGKQATAVEIQKVIEYANTSGIKIIFYQEEFDDSQAQTIADEINGKVIQVSPLSENYIQSLWDFVNALVHQED
jgi:zinc transport system substrate-binding protein